MLCLETPILEYKKKRSTNQYLYPSKENVDSDHVVVKHLPVCKEIEVWILLGIREQLLHEHRHFYGAVDVEGNGKDGYLRERRSQ